ncbi:hypothetical protein [Coleofasciculus sp. F4-SAH-05]|uniref:hypothetical protein n=1 Tax=Coleofasciculus sp. F4-SAH-05 TaxID=3069525 RepID=UPI0032F34B98
MSFVICYLLFVIRHSSFVVTDVESNGTEISIKRSAEFRIYRRVGIAHQQTSQ